ARLLARERRLPVVEIQRPAPRDDIARDQPRGRRDISIPGPGCLVAVAIEAGALRQRLRLRAIPLRLRLRCRVGLPDPGGDELDDDEESECADYKPTR